MNTFLQEPVVAYTIGEKGHVWRTRTHEPQDLLPFPEYS